MARYLIVIFSLALMAMACGPKNSSANGSEQGENASATADSALMALNKRIADDPENFQNYLDRAKYYGSKQQYALALKDLDRALLADSTKGSIYLYKGEVMFLQENVKGAYDQYANCLRFEANNTECLLHKAELDIILKNYDVAMTHINDALKQDDHLAKAYYLKGRLYTATGDTTLSASSYQTAIEVDPDYYDAYIEVGLLYAAKKHKLAEEYYNSALQVKPKSVEAWYNKAMFFQESGYLDPTRYTKAFACYDTILKIDPKFSAAQFNKGYINLVYLKKYEEAIKDFTNATAIFPQYFQAYYNRGLAEEKLGHKKEAETDYRMSLAIQPNYDDAAKALSRVLGEKE
jgi:tetratricopeptide (TPR) repeat protein